MKSILLALASAVLFALSLPPYNLEFLGWFALAPLLVAVQGRRPLESIGLGLITGIVCGALHSAWSRNTDTILWGFIPFFWMTLLFAGVATAARTHGANGLRWIVWVSVIGITGEWLTTFLPIPINTALCQYQQIPLIQIAAVTGIWGVSLLVWLTNAVLADAFIEHRFRPRRILPALALVSFCYLTGGIAVAITHGGNARTLTVAAIQDFTGDETHDIADGPTANIDRDAMTRKAAAHGARLAVWSEEALGSTFEPTRADDPTRTLARKSDTYLVVGHSAPSPAKSYNCASLLSPEGDVLGTYHKVHLYLGENQTIAPGDTGKVYHTPEGVMGMEICFDSCYTDITRQEAAAGAQLIAMPNYDPPTPRGVLHYLHAAMLPFRAVENHVGFIRADSNGLSQIVSPTGKVLAQGDLYTAETVTAQLPLSSGQGTFYTRFGDWLAYLCIATAVLVMVTRERFRTAPASAS